MANEFKHKTVGTQLTQTEYEAIGGHVLDSQAAGDIIYASSTTQLSRLGIGTAGKLLAVNSGATAPEYVAAVTGVTSVLNAALVIGRDADNDIDFGTDNTILFRADGADQIKLTNGALLPVTDDDIDLGSSSLQFKDGYFDGTLEADAITVGGTAVLTGGAETAITSVLNASLVVGRDADNDIDFGTDNNIIFRAGAADQIKLIDGALAPVTDNDVDLGTSSLEFKDAFFDGTVTTDALAMATNTADMLLIADGSTFNPTAVSSLSEISTVANDDVFIAIDTSGGGLKKIARSAIVSGLAASGAISNVIEDTSPELGGDLDVLTHGIVTGASNRNIALTPHGTGVVRIDGSNGVDIESGAISIKNAGAESYVRFYCESSNAHYTQLQASPHSAYSGNVTVVLPAAATNLVGDDTTQTLTNKTLTTPKIAEIDSLSSGSITLDAEANIELNADGGTITFADAGSSLGTITSSGYSGNAATATVATTVTITDNESTDEDNAVVFTAGGDVDGGNLGLESDGDLTYNPSTGRLTATQLAGTLQTAAQTNITSLGTLTTLTVDNVITNGTTIGHTDDTDLLTLADGSLTLAGNLTLSDDKTITLGNEGQVVLGDNTPANGKGTGLIIKGTLKTGVTAGMVVHLHSDGEYEHADKDDETMMPAVGVALEDAGSNKKILIYGIYNDTALSLTQGEELYVSDDGAVSHTVPGSGDFLQRVGVALDSNTVLFMPSLDVIEHA
tara:strand:+ start:1023 stop:3224 length:2202 start_codon:yes stop_codon:yes gene_type:complete